ncbi:MAG TPA: PHB depolymerase family esterase [Candidatus Angelobacter sp.]|nr:PHB depolymerase family esterase [Candidatus Angelobacter sp.]
MQHYRIDPNRVYAAGFSGGARMSSMLGFYQNDIFRGTIQNCGTDFYRAVPQVAATSTLDTASQPYGLLGTDLTPAELAAAKQVRFALITGTRDFRRGNILDIFNGGFAHDGFQAKLFDVRGMGHDVADGKTLSAVLDFLEGARAR